VKKISINNIWYQRLHERGFGVLIIYLMKRIYDRSIIYLSYLDSLLYRVLNIDLYLVKKGHFEPKRTYFLYLVSL
jgi:hypothetical protein